MIVRKILCTAIKSESFHFRRSDNYAYLSIIKNRSMNIGVLVIKLNVTNKHLFTLLIVGKTSLNDRIDF